MIGPFTAAPPLDTGRLTLRAHGIADFDECAALWSDTDVTRYISGRASTVEESWARLLRYVGHWAVVGYGYWAVREKSTGRYVGELGFADYRRDMTMSFQGAPEIGWVLATWAHGQGFATEGVRAAVAWADAELRAARTACMIAPENVASVRVAAKCGYREFARATYKGAPAILFERAQNAVDPTVP